MATTYPAPAPTLSGDVLSIHRLLQSPTLIQRRLNDLSAQRFIADAILPARFVAAGGAVLFEQNESIFADRDPQSVAPGSNYPETSVGIGPAQLAAVQKWGEDVPITDESIKRMQLNPVDRAFTKVVNTLVRKIDTIALAAVASSVTNGTAVTASWKTATAAQMLKDVLASKGRIEDLGEGYDVDTVVMDTLTHANALAAFTAAGYVPREDNASNPALTGDFPVIAGLRFLAVPSARLATAGTILVLDSTQLGGMADEQLGGPGYAGTTAGIEGKTIREEKTDSYLLRARRVTVPVVINPDAAEVLTGATA